MNREVVADTDVVPVFLLEQPLAGEAVSGRLSVMDIALTEAGDKRVPFDMAVAIYAKGIRFGRRHPDPLKWHGFSGAAVLIPTGRVKDGMQRCRVAHARALQVPGTVRGGWFVQAKVPPEISALVDEVGFEAGL